MLFYIYKNQVPLLYLIKTIFLGFKVLKKF